MSSSIYLSAVSRLLNKPLQNETSIHSLKKIVHSTRLAPKTTYTPPPSGIRHYAGCRNFSFIFHRSHCYEQRLFTQHGLSSTRNHPGKNCLRQSLQQRQQQRFISNKQKTKASEYAEETIDNANLSMWEKWTAPRPMPPRNTFEWYLEMALVCSIFAITGTSTMVVVRPAVTNVLGLKGSFKEGPWSYRLCSLVIMTPVYATMLVCVGTIFGRHAYFRHFAVKMFSRFGIPPEAMDKNFHETAKNFRKW